MKKALLIVLAVVLLTGCAASQQLAKPVLEASETLKALCELYEANRPLVISTRAYLVEHRSEIPPIVFRDLQKIDATLPLLDQRGRQVCEIAKAAEIVQANAKWRDEIGASLVRLITVGLQLKAQGVI